MLSASESVWVRESARVRRTPFGPLFSNRGIEQFAYNVYNMFPSPHLRSSAYNALHLGMTFRFLM